MVVYEKCTDDKCCSVVDSEKEMRVGCCDCPKCGAPPYHGNKDCPVCRSCIKKIET